MKNYKDIITGITTHPATVRVVASGIAAVRYTGSFCQDAIDSGVIVRRWWNRRGQDYAWGAISAVAMALFAMACAACVAGFVAASALRLLEDVWIEYGTLDGHAVETPAIGLIPEPEVLVWAKARWPQLVA